MQLKNGCRGHLKSQNEAIEQNNAFVLRTFKDEFSKAVFSQERFNELPLYQFSSPGREKSLWSFWFFLDLQIMLYRVKLIRYEIGLFEVNHMLSLTQDNLREPQKWKKPYRVE